MGAPTGQYSKRGKLIDMDYDCINTGTYNYVFSDSENQAPGGTDFLLDLMEEWPHAKFDILPYEDNFYGIPGRNYGNTWL